MLTPWQIRRSEILKQKYVDGSVREAQSMWILVSCVNNHQKASTKREQLKNWVHRVTCSVEIGQPFYSAVTVP